jgi:hypothetical protein
MTSMKFVKMLILALGLVSLATASSFAAVAFNTTATVNMMNVNAQTGLIGSVLYTPMANGTVSAGEIISLNLPGNVPISNLYDISVSLTGTAGSTAFKEAFGAVLGSPFTQVPGGTFSTVYGTTLTAGTSGATVSGVSVQVNQYSLVISFGASIAFTTADFIKIDGIRVDATAMAVGGGNMQVNLTNVNGQATTDTPQLTVATFVPESNIIAIAGVTGVTGTSGGLQFNANGTPYNSGTGNRNIVTVTIKELFTNAFESKNVVHPSYPGSTYNSQMWSNTKILIPITIPAGLPLTITGVNLAGPDGATFVNGQLQGGAITVNPLKIGISSQSPNKLESLQVGITFGMTSGGVMPLNSAPITFSAQLDPPAPAALPYSSQQYYGFQLKYKAPATAPSGSIPVNFVPLTSNLMSQFNSAIRATGGGFAYDTGFAISNLSGSNPSTLSLYPIGTAGTINVVLYPMDGTGPFTINTSALTSTSAKLGLDATTGALSSKATWKVLLSQLLVPAGLSATADFTGFVRFNCNFQESAGVAYIGDGLFQNFAVGFPMASDMPTNFGNLNFNVGTGAVTGNVIDPKF